jgi:fructokinase
VQGALLAWLHRHEVADVRVLGQTEWQEALNYAARAAAVTVSRSGAEPPTAAELRSVFGA